MSQSALPRDEFEVPDDSPLAAEHDMLNRVLAAYDENQMYFYSSGLNSCPAVTDIKQLPPADQCRVISAAIERLESIAQRHSPHKNDLWRWGAIIQRVVQILLRKKLPVEQPLLLQLLGWGSQRMLISYGAPYSGILKALESYAKSNELSPELTEAAADCRKLLAEASYHDMRKMLDRFDAVLGTEAELPISPGEAWSDAALADLKAMDSAQRRQWVQLITHCYSASSGSPKKGWLQTAESLLGQLSFAAFRACVLRWFPLVDKPRTAPPERQYQWQPDQTLLISDGHADILKGMVWCCSLSEDRDVSRALTALAISAYKKVPGVGPRAVKIGNACVYALGAMPGMDGVGQLALLKVRVKFGTAQKGIEKALIATADRVGIPRDELEEMSVPTYGLTDVGARSEQLGDVTAEVCVAGRKPELRWLKADGKPQKSVPAAVKKDFAEELKEIKQSVKDIEKMLPAQAARIEQCYLQQKQWPFGVWRQRYPDHPLVGTLARRLIWKFSKKGQQTSAIWRDDQFVDRKDKAVDWVGNACTVQLWHPLDEDTDTITGWRDWLMEHHVQQPFKQAHREIYLLTDAERRTECYSNRFAAHILKQHQFNALCGARGWKNKLRLMVDDEYPPAHLQISQHDLRAEFWIEGAGQEYGMDTNESGTYLYLTTDQVRFYRADAAENTAHAGGGSYGSRGGDREENHPLDLEQIPPLVFSEVMRDVDLFVGVASVGNDPQWADGGPEGRYQEYWHAFSFGDLGSTAETRKEVVQNLVPRLKIADRCSFSDRFLIVRGDVRTYKIHLGSGNIMMEPNDAYLCIVPKQSLTRQSDKVFLPFEGDNMLSIILSKAIMLADDTKITDKTILSQIRR